MAHTFPASLLTLFAVGMPCFVMGLESVVARVAAIVLSVAIARRRHVVRLDVAINHDLQRLRGEVGAQLYIHMPPHDYAYQTIKFNMTLKSLWSGRLVHSRFKVTNLSRLSLCCRTL